jgi:V/A-type H+-transporting ATPase subunit I
MPASYGAAGVVALGIVLLVTGRGALGLVMGPLEFVGTLGNVLSYLRLAAVGLASTYLAMVANELSVLGPIWLGVFIGLFFHVLNLALASFSPMIQALRLHYVEFFSKFYEGGGQPFRPFGGRAAS